ncbi:MAG: 50S ribosomal protein L4 [Anaerolineae bacterium]
MKIPMLNMSGEIVGEIELNPAVFEAPVNVPLMHQALTRQLANARQGNAKTKNRSEVHGSTRKMWKQKGTGRARQGSRKAPHWKGGGNVFGPVNRDFSQKMPLRMRHGALRSALSAKAADHGIVVVDQLDFEKPSAKTMASVLVNIKAGRKTLVLLSDSNVNVELSVRNLDNAKYLRAQYLNVRDLMGHETVLLPKSALDVIDNLLG